MTVEEQKLENEELLRRVRWKMQRELLTQDEAITLLMQIPERTQDALRGTGSSADWKHDPETLDELLIPSCWYETFPLTAENPRSFGIGVTPYRVVITGFDMTAQPALAAGGTYSLQTGSGLALECSVEEEVPHDEAAIVKEYRLTGKVLPHIPVSCGMKLFAGPDDGFLEISLTDEVDPALHQAFPAYFAFLDGKEQAVREYYRELLKTGILTTEYL